MSVPVVLVQFQCFSLIRVTATDTCELGASLSTLSTENPVLALTLLALRVSPLTTSHARSAPSGVWRSITSASPTMRSLPSGSSGSPLDPFVIVYRRMLGWRMVKVVDPRDRGRRPGR